MTPKRKPLVRCDCGTLNDPDERTGCMDCHTPVSQPQVEQEEAE